MDVTIMKTCQKHRDASRANKIAADAVRSALHGHFDQQAFDAALQQAADRSAQAEIQRSQFESEDTKALSFKRAYTYDLMSAWHEFMACQLVVQHGD